MASGAGVASPTYAPPRGVTRFPRPAQWPARGAFAAALLLFTSAPAAQSAFDSTGAPASAAGAETLAWRHLLDAFSARNYNRVLDAVAALERHSGMTAELWYYRGFAHARLGDHAEALAALETAHRGGYATGELLYELALALQRARRCPEAYARLGEIPDPAEFFAVEFFRGLCALDMDRPGAAITHLSQHLATTPELAAEALTLRAAAKLAAGDTPGARADLEDARARVTPDSPQFADISATLASLEATRAPLTALVITGVQYDTNPYLITAETEPGLANYQRADGSWLANGTVIWRPLPETLELTAAGGYTKFFALDALDFANLTLQAATGTRAGEARLKLEPAIAFNWLAGSFYAHKPSGALQATIPFAAAWQAQITTQSGYTFYHQDRHSIYEGPWLSGAAAVRTPKLGGWLRVQDRYFASQQWAQESVLSYLRHGNNLSLWADSAPWLTLNLEGEINAERYGAVDTLYGVRRTGLAWLAGASATVEFTPNILAILAYDFTWHDANVTTFQYLRHAAGLQGLVTF